MQATTFYRGTEKILSVLHLYICIYIYTPSSYITPSKCSVLLPEGFGNLFSSHAFRLHCKDLMNLSGNKNTAR